MAMGQAWGLPDFKAWALGLLHHPPRHYTSPLKDEAPPYLGLPCALLGHSGFLAGWMGSLTCKVNNHLCPPQPRPPRVGWAHAWLPCSTWGTSWCPQGYSARSCLASRAPDMLPVSEKLFTVVMCNAFLREQMAPPIRCFKRKA